MVWIARCCCIFSTASPVARRLRVGLTRPSSHSWGLQLGRAKPQLLVLEDLLRRLRVEIVPFDAEHYREALSAFRRYGKGRHPAALNFGDCLSYAVAKVAGMPPAYVGDDFAQTDLA